jgi:hypothetical protein
MRFILNFFLVLLILGWIFAFFVFAVAGPLIHLLLVVALIVFVVRLVSGRRLA